MTDDGLPDARGRAAQARRDAELAFGEYAQTRTVMRYEAVTSRGALRAHIDRVGAWGWTLPDFQNVADVRIEGDTAYVT